MAKFWNRSLFLMVTQVAFITLSSANSPPSALTAQERDSLRFHLQNLSNELELLRKNQRADARDVKRQEQGFEELKVFERIPFQENIPGLRSELTQSAKESHLTLLRFKITGKSPSPPEVPKKVSTHSNEFQFSADQLVEKIYFEAQVSGKKGDVEQWIKTWHENQLRLTEPNTKIPQHSIKQLRPHLWKVSAHAFCFRDVQFPTLVPRNPRELLPTWAQKDPQTFARGEPLLWNWVTQIESLIPNSEPYYQTRSRFLLNDARMHFFVSHAQ